MLQRSEGEVLNVSENGRSDRRAARARLREKRREDDNVQYVRRVPEVNGTVYTDEMSKAYWRGLQDGEATAVRMVKRSRPENVRVRSLALATEKTEQQSAVVSVDMEQLSAITAEDTARNETPEQWREPEGVPAKPEEADRSALTEHQAHSDNMIIGMNNKKSNEASRQSNGRPAIVLLESNDKAPEATYELSGKPSSAAHPSGVDESRKSGSWTAFLSNAASKAAGSIQKTGDISTLSVQPFREMSRIRQIIIVLSIMLFVYAIFPIFLGVVSVGIIPIALIAWFFFTAALLWNHIEGCKSRALNTVFAVIAVVVALGIVGMAFISGKMIGASLHTLPEEENEVTVVVLGCRVKGDRPSLMLENRLRTAADYLLKNPQAHCIVTGGQGEDEEIAEAVIMKNYLLAAGVSEERILVEKKSTSTVENLEFAAKLIDKYNCYENVVIVSDRFHQYRASLAASDAGIDAYAMPCETAWYLVGHYWFREMAGIAQIWLKG